ncbi:hypothetical protein DYQ86_05565 [Acidobacteria bacterium AB60]|nr:hypothetical protein DYQ86_05565 [Acidobacteria bacterium AB60]
MIPLNKPCLVFPLLAIIFAGNGASSRSARAQRLLESDRPASETARIASSPSPSTRQDIFNAIQAWRMREATYYKRNWGVDILGIHIVSSGHMLEFRYNVIDAAKAAPLNEKKFQPYVLDRKSGARLTVPVMEKIGQLRQTAPPVENRTYWMVFGNEGKIVHPGDKVDVHIGSFSIAGIPVD